MIQLVEYTFYPVLVPGMRPQWHRLRAVSSGDSPVGPTTPPDPFGLLHSGRGVCGSVRPSVPSRSTGPHPRSTTRSVTADTVRDRRTGQRNHIGPNASLCDLHCRLHSGRGVSAGRQTFVSLFDSRILIRADRCYTLDEGCPWSTCGSTSGPRSFALTDTNGRSTSHVYTLDEGCPTRAATRLVCPSRRRITRDRVR